MSLKDDLTNSVDGILSKTFEERGGQVVPTSDGVALSNGAVKLDAAFLYADLAGSAQIASVCPWHTTAKIIRAYLDCSVRIIRFHGGQIRSFDGDRVMGVFIGDAKRSNATKAALKIKWATENLVHTQAHDRFKSVKNNGIKIQQACGIDVGNCRAVRAGIRNSNDLIWVGKPASFAAKLSDLRAHPYCSFISERVYDRLSDETKLSGKGVNMWERRSRQFAGYEEVFYRSSYWWVP